MFMSSENTQTRYAPFSRFACDNASARYFYLSKQSWYPPFRGSK